MQFTKDSFYLALRDRLAVLNPKRTIVVDGVERPAILVAENEPRNAATPFTNAFYLSWSAPQFVAGSEGAARPLMKMDCQIAYRAACSLAGDVDRGRAISALDAELLRLLAPPRTPKLDATVANAAPLGSFVFWGTPVFEGTDGARTATLTVFFFSEVEES